MSPFIAFAVVLIAAFTVVWLLGTIWGHLDSAPNWVTGLIIGLWIFGILWGIMIANNPPLAN